MPGCHQHRVTHARGVDASATLPFVVNHHGVNTALELCRIDVARRDLQSTNTRRLLSCFLDFVYQPGLLALAQSEEPPAEPYAETVDLEAPAAVAPASDTASSLAGQAPPHVALRLPAALSTLAPHACHDPHRRQVICRPSARRCCHLRESKLQWRARRRRCRMRRVTAIQTPLPRPPVRRTRTTRSLPQTPDPRRAQ